MLGSGGGLVHGWPTMKTLASLLAATAFAATAFAAPPTDNPVATFYDGPRGYPAWTNAIHWGQAIDMSAYAKGKTSFEKFESARDELAAKGGGVLYYPAGTYDFSEGPFDGPQGRGLMLKSGVVIRGEAPAGKPLATTGKLDLPTKFVFGFKPREGVDTGGRLTLVLEGGDQRPKKDGEFDSAPLILSFAVKDGNPQNGEVKAFRRGFGRDVWPGMATFEGATGRVGVSVELTIPAGKKGGVEEKAIYKIWYHRPGDNREGDPQGSFTGTVRGQEVKGEVTGHFLTIRPETPRDWNMIGLAPEPGKRISDVNDVGIAWVHLVGAVVYFGPDVKWGDTWATAGSWKSGVVKAAWKDRKPDGTHPWDPFAGGKTESAGLAKGRLVFGCVLECAASTNDSITMGRPDHPEGFGENGYSTNKFAPRIAAYGKRVLVANNLLPMCQGRNFKYTQTTRRTFPSGGGAGMGFDPPRESVVFFDYNKTVAIEVNKSLLGLVKGSITGQEGAEPFFAEGVAVIDNWVFNNGHKGFDISGSWVTIARNHNERTVLREGWDPERIGGWELTLDGHLETGDGGNGSISDNLARAFDLAGRNVWVEANTYNNTGSSPGNDGEGILAQAHGGTQVFSWAITHNKHDKGDGQTSYMGGWDVNMAGALFGWNKLPGWVGAVKVGERDSSDVAYAGNEAAGGLKAQPGAQIGDKEGAKMAAPGNVTAGPYEGDAVKVTWKDNADGEVGFRVERQIAGGEWLPIAYRPPQIQGDPNNPPEWIDFLAPPGQPLTYRVIALDSTDKGPVSEPSAPVKL